MPQNIGDNFIHEEGIARIQEADALRLAKYRMRKGDIVYSRRGDVEKRALVRENNEGWLCGTGCLRVRLGEQSDHDPAFVSYLLGTEETRAWIVRHAVGATMPNLNTSILSAVPLVIPEPAVQQAVAEVLAAFDDKIVANTRLAQTLDEYLMSRWTALSLSETLERVKLDGLVQDVIGGDWGTSELADPSTEEVLCIRGADITDLQMSGLGSMPRRFIKPNSLRRRQLANLDLVVEMSGGSPTQSTGRAVLITDALLNRLNLPLSSSNFCRIVRLGNAKNAYVVYALLRDSWSRGEFFQYENGSTGIKNLAFSDYCAAKEVPMPSDVELNDFNQFAGGVFLTMQSIGEESAHLIRTRDTLLPQLMSGKLRIKDAEKVLENAGV
ncbi:restriction endonuclease subunit S [Pseudarthrobacter sp. NIBRBAC000502771]|uniref:restriction endonuclease subunit S n=1 Tax=Pseudarthrobacter sp. NIBRBAC000502771 TaxID=2590774 RepID=UPI001AEF4E3D|nr:restriction endonuclease subunit S [Pseudarthrobacter sp. NIBRBAC000502771]